jgi:uncharacterized protein YggE
MKLAVRLFFVATLVISASLIVCAQDKQEPRLITVSGQAEVNVAPDEVVFDLTVQTINKDLRAAKSQTDDRLRKIIELTRKYKILAKDVQTDYIRLEPRYRGNDESRLFIGYSVRKDLVFTLRDVSQAEELLSELIESGVSRLNGIRFQTSELRKYRDQARAMPMKAAQEKAIALTATIGQKIGKAYSIDETPASRIASYSNSNFQLNSTVSSEESSESQGTLALGQIKVTATVTVKFELN